MLLKLWVSLNARNDFISEEKQNLQTVTRDEPKYGRNEIVKITNGQETKELKYKKALSLIESGEWKII